MQSKLQQVRQHLLTGVSYVVPFIACGGILIAAAIALAPMTPEGPDFSTVPRLKVVLDVGTAAFALALPVLAGYIAYGMASRPGLPGMLGGYLAAQVGAGFLGAVVAGLFAGFVVAVIRKIPVHRHIRPLMPIIVIPIVSGLIVGVLMLEVIGPPTALAMEWLGRWLEGLSGGNTVVLAAILGAMIAFDMGGPVNKAAFFFGTAMIKEGNYQIMGACAAAICTPPLGLGVATLVARRLWSREEKESGVAALGMGVIGITEGAIPFAAADPLRVIPCIMGGSIVAAIIAMLGGVGDHAPHGGLIVLPIVDNRMIYVVAIAAGVLVTATAINLLRSVEARRNAQRLGGAVTNPVGNTRQIAGTTLARETR